MGDEHFQLKTSEFINQTSVHPVGATILVLLIVSTFILPKRYIIVPFLIMACAIPTGQRISIASLDFTFLRLLVLAGAARIYFGGYFLGIKWVATDYLIIAWCIVTTIARVTLYGNLGALVYKLGTSFDILGTYFIVRSVFHSWRDFDLVIKSLVLLSLMNVCFFAVEMLTQRNPFSVMGGVAEITNIRKGRLRCQGPFPHPIIAGCYWASTLPLFASQFVTKTTSRIFYTVGFLAALTIVIASASSTPAMFVVFSGLAWLGFFARKFTRSFRWLCIFALIGMQLFMSKPIWHLMARIDIFGGSTGIHRYHLVNAAIHRITEWAVVGCKSTAHWGFHLADITNQYIYEGVSGGLVGMLLFVTIIFLSFRAVGIVARASNQVSALKAWSLGAALFGHSMSFLAVTYFGGQITFLWWAQIAMISSLYSGVVRQEGYE